METITRIREVSRSDFIKNYLFIINGLVRLTRKEISVLELGINDMKPDGTMFANKDIRYSIAQRLGLSKYNLNNFVKSLKDKNVLKIDNEKCYTLNPRLQFDNMLTAGEVEVVFKLIVKDENS